MDIDKYFNGSTSRYLKTSDINAPQVVTVRGWSIEKLAGREKVLIHFKELHRALVLNRENSTRLKKIFGTTNADDLIGRRLTIYVDEAVEFNGTTRGGLRLRAADSVPAGQQPAGADAIGQDVKRTTNDVEEK